MDVRASVVSDLEAWFYAPQAIDVLGTDPVVFDGVQPVLDRRTRRLPVVETAAGLVRWLFGPVGVGVEGRYCLCGLLRWTAPVERLGRRRAGCSGAGSGLDLQPEAVVRRRVAPPSVLIGCQSSRGRVFSTRVIRESAVSHSMIDSPI